MFVIIAKISIYLPSKLKEKDESFLGNIAIKILKNFNFIFVAKLFITSILNLISNILLTFLATETEDNQKYLKFNLAFSSTILVAIIIIVSYFC